MEVILNQFLFQVELSVGSKTKNVSFSSFYSRLGIMGASGCGKSSLVRALAGINNRFQGDFEFKGQNINLLHPWERKYSYLPQSIQLLPHLNVRDNLLFPKDSIVNDEVIDGFGIAHLLERMPRHLSGGEKQKVGLARALCYNSKLLILDEPFSSLDTKSKSSSIAFLDQYCQIADLPMIVVSHREDELLALKCDIHSMDDCP